MSSTDSPWGTESRRRRASKFPVKREAVLSAAAGLFRRKGYDGASLAELAEVLNITKPTLYYYVGSKEELFTEIVTRAQGENLAAMQDAIAADVSGYAKLEAIMLRYIEVTNSDFGACLMGTMPNGIDPALTRGIQARMREANQLIYQVLEEGQKDGTLSITDPTVALHALFGSLNWIPRWYKPSGRLTLKKLAEQHVHILLNGIRGSGQPAKSRRKG